MDFLDLKAAVQFWTDTRKGIDDDQIEPLQLTETSSGRPMGTKSWAHDLISQV